MHSLDPVPPPMELVVARHAEDTAWLRRVPREIRITVYDKGDGTTGGIPLPNIGREAHTYLHHLAERHDTLADLTVFVQGHPFDHAPDLHQHLRNLAAGSETIRDFQWLGFLADTDDPRGRRLFVPWSKNPAREELDMENFHRALFGGAGPDAYRFFVGAQFAVRREAALRRSRSFYQAARELAATFPLAPHCFERCWDRVFGCDGTAERLPPDRMTAYFKPIRRLENCKEPLVRPPEPR
ncbi:MAG: DUF3431 domain-containing protein [Chthoniobacterales bacterium]|nr:DUF3431 domain-containing protein [Chthoniobacterales bacterium]